MNLSDYISLTLSEIAEGVQKANEIYELMGDGNVLTETRMEISGIPYAYKNSKSGVVRKPIINVGFHVGVELQESKEKGGSLKVVAIDADISKKGWSKVHPRNHFSASFNSTLVAVRKRYNSLARA